MTNFERITESPEALAGFLNAMASGTGCCIVIDVLRQRDTCGKTHEFDNGCKYDHGDCTFDALEWLQEECE